MVINGSSPQFYSILLLNFNNNDHNCRSFRAGASASKVLVTLFAERQFIRSRKIPGVGEVIYLVNVTVGFTASAGL